MDRRSFLQGLLALTAGLAASSARRAASRSRQDADTGAAAGTAAASGAAADDDALRAGVRLAPGSLPRRRLGRTDESLPLLGLGGHHMGAFVQDGRPKTAHALIETAIEEGVRFFDTAESYQGGKSEAALGEVLSGMRDEVFLMTKTFKLQRRSAESAREDLEGSLQRLKTDHLDLWQLHSVRTAQDTDRAFREGGAMEYLFQAREEGLTRFVGVTGHQHPAANRRALHHWDLGHRFDTMQMPINPLDFHQLSFQKGVLPALVERDIGVIAMKTQAHGRLVQDGITTVAENLRFVLSLPVAVAVVGMDSVERVRENARLVRELLPMDADEMEALLERIAPRAALEKEWYKRA